MNVSGNWSLIISGDQLDFDDIRKKLLIKPSRIIRKGEIKSKVIGPSQYDVWVFERNFKSRDEIARTLDELLMELQPFEEYIKLLSNDIDIAIKFYIQSDFAQIGATLPAQSIKKLAEMNIRMEISVFSWGKVENI